MDSSQSESQLHQNDTIRNHGDRGEQQTIVRQRVIELYSMRFGGMCERQLFNLKDWITTAVDRNQSQSTCPEGDPR